MDLRPGKPCDRIGLVLGSQGAVVRWMRALPHGYVSSAVETVRALRARPVVKLSFVFLVLTATRSGKDRGPCGRRWAGTTVRGPSEARIRGSSRENRGPLCWRTLEILEEARTLGRGCPFVFPGARASRMASAARSELLKELGATAVAHGFRSSFRDWAAKETDHCRKVVEAAYLAQTCSGGGSRTTGPRIWPGRTETRKPGRFAEALARDPLLVMSRPSATLTVAVRQEDAALPANPQPPTPRCGGTMPPECS